MSRGWGRLLSLSLALLLCPFDSQAANITTVAGTGPSVFPGGYNGDGMAATSAQLGAPLGVFVDASGNIYIADQMNNRIRKVDAGTGLISTVAGIGPEGFPGGYNGDGIAATSAQLDGPSGVCVDASGNIYIADYGNHRVRKVNASTGLISTVAGTGSTWFNGDGIAATSANLYGPFGICLDASGNIYMACGMQHRIRKVTVSSGLISTVAGNGNGGFLWDNWPATSTWVNDPYGVFVDAAGNIYIADTWNKRVRKVNAADGMMTTVAGDGTYADGGDGMPATSAQLKNPTGVYVDASGNIYIADYISYRIRKVTAATGVINTVAGTGVSGYNGDGIDATTAQLYFPYGLWGDASGNIYIADTGNNRIREVVVNSKPNTPSQPSGPASGLPSTSYTYSTSTTDPEGDQVKYGWDWNGDGTVDEWSGLVNSGRRTAGATRGRAGGRIP